MINEAFFDSVRVVSILVVFYANILYPTVLCLVGLFIRKQKCNLPVTSQHVRLSVLIAAHNEEIDIFDKVENILNCIYPRDSIEVVIACDGCTDGTVKCLRGFSEQEYIKILDFKTRRGKASALNDAVDNSNGQLLLFCDANVYFDVDAIRVLVSRMLSDSTIGAISGCVSVVDSGSAIFSGERIYSEIEKLIQVGEGTVGSSIGVDGGMYLIRRNLYTRVDSDTILDDYSIAMSVINRGKRVVFEPRAIGYERGTPSCNAEFKRRMRLTSGAIQSIFRKCWPSITHYPLDFFKWFSHKFLRWLNPLWMFCLVITSLPYSFSMSIKCIPFWMLVGCILGFLLVVVFPKLGNVRLFGLAFFLVISHVAMVYGLLTGLCQRPSGRWERTERSSIRS